MCTYTSIILLYISDCWYLYTLNPLDRYVTGHVDVEPDQTIEILMTDLDPGIMKLFCKKSVKDGREATKVENEKSAHFKHTLVSSIVCSYPASTRYSQA